MNVFAKATHRKAQRLSKDPIDGRSLGQQRSADGSYDGGMEVGVHLDVTVAR
ncbi:MAG: hypothetical protein ACI89G_002333 [Minisyncoccia bacterium]|jgi:hypothetical protein